ncbi:hypothetical protein PAXRUDRAFT_309890 [Paxillus rubicundulus Ve08.2h10]|uniref:Uncharacterized protein n=1 Tax=Paxillus rubicundulus Ve08.2h10 TaxID=930991 RepID=A0A0D0DKN2_9AGAM|nr:hypothetical protein PAXRUDRAFT_309890 [Paxillus rubicundulus Ve08.2h10]
MISVISLGGRLDNGTSGVFLPAIVGTATDRRSCRPISLQTHRWTHSVPSCHHPAHTCRLLMAVSPRPQLQRHRESGHAMPMTFNAL